MDSKEFSWISINWSFVKKMKCLFTVLFLALLTGCEPDKPMVIQQRNKMQSVLSHGDAIEEFTYKLSDGRTVVCLRYRENLNSNSSGSISCDWSSATRWL